MNFYKLEFSTTTDKSGCYPQITGANRKYDFSSPRSFKKLTSYEFPSETPKMDGLLLDKKANKTDILTCLGVMYTVGLFVSKALKAIMENSRISNYKFYPVKLEYGKAEIDNYEFIHVVEAEDIIDFKMSEFVLLDTQSLMTQPEPIEINSMGEWTEKYPVYYRDKKENITISKVKLVDDFDMFRLPFSNVLYVSKKLKTELEKKENIPIVFKEPWVTFC